MTDHLQVNMKTQEDEIVEWKSLLAKYYKEGEEVRTARGEDRNGLLIACVFVPLFLTFVIFGLRELLVKIGSPGGLRLVLFDVGLILFSFLGLYVVRHAYHYGRRSLKLHLNLMKEIGEEVIMKCPANLTGIVTQGILSHNRAHFKE